MNEWMKNPLSFNDFLSFSLSFSFYVYPWKKTFSQANNCGGGEGRHRGDRRGKTNNMSLWTSLWSIFKFLSFFRFILALSLSDLIKWSHIEKLNLPLFVSRWGWKDFQVVQSREAFKEFVSQYYCSLLPSLSLSLLILRDCSEVWARCEFEFNEFLFRFLFPNRAIET